MKKSILALALLLCLCLTGCTDLLERSYQVSTAHVDRPATAGDPSVLQASDYRELVSAVLYFVSQGEETGSIQLLDYPGDVETALAAACLEVATEDPLGAYCVDYIRHELTRVVSYDQATLSIHYRRTMEQVDSMVRVTGTSAIRTELREALSQFRDEVVLRMAYFAGDADTIANLIRQAYYDNPTAALGFPQVEIALYPESGRERVVEILLTYPGSAEELLKKGEALTARAGELARPLGELTRESAALRTAQILRGAADYDPQGEDTPYAALVEGSANDQGLALAYLLLCQGEALSCQVVEGTIKEPGEDGESVTASRFWNMLSLSGERRYLDPSAARPELLTAQELFDRGYRWPGGPVEESPEEGLAADGQKEGEKQAETQ